MMIEPGEGGNHGEKDAGKQNGHLANGMEIEIIRLMNGFGCGEPGTGGGGDHETFAKKGRLADKNGPEDDNKEEEV